jgi:hypothetical protein
MSDAELDREAAVILASLFQRPVEEIEALLPKWKLDDTLAAVTAELKASSVQEDRTISK